jgi:lipid II:glycine glycyltransferase (peptidoglycan interpeptide bridge formation enzyme)
MEDITPEYWNKSIASLPASHILQSWEWGQLKSQFGWEAKHYLWSKADYDLHLTTKSVANLENIAAAALVLSRTVAIGGDALRAKVMYLPKGPLLRDWATLGERQKVINDLRNLAHDQKAVFLKLDPDVRLGTGVPGTDRETFDPVGRSFIDELGAAGWIFSPDQIQFRNTVCIKLEASEAELLQRMKQKTRYNIRLAERKGVCVRRGDQTDIPMLYHMYAETSQRDGFVIREAAYYQAVWETFINNGSAYPLIATVDNKPIAAVIIFMFARRAWYLYGMSSLMHRELMPNYLLQWEAIRLAKQAGCLEYDLWGAPDRFDSADPLWGVYRFKEGLGGEVVRTVGAWDYPARRQLYWLYTRIIPPVLDWMRYRGKQRTRRDAAV